MKRWSADHIRRAAAAMREARTPDFFVLARICLEAAVRSADDLGTLLDPASTRAPAKLTPIAAVALA